VPHAPPGNFLDVRLSSVWRLNIHVGAHLHADTPSSGAIMSDVAMLLTRWTHVSHGRAENARATYPSPTTAPVPSIPATARLLNCPFDALLVTARRLAAISTIPYVDGSHICDVDNAGRDRPIYRSGQGAALQNHSSHGTLQSPFCLSWRGSPRVMTSTIFRLGEVEETFCVVRVRFKHPCRCWCCLSPHRCIELVQIKRQC